MSQRTIRITDEMVSRFTRCMADYTNRWATPGAIKAGLEAALEPHLERRKGERRTIGVNGAAPDGTGYATGAESGGKTARCRCPGVKPCGPVITDEMLDAGENELHDLFLPGPTSFREVASNCYRAMLYADPRPTENTDSASGPSKDAPAETCGTAVPPLGPMNDNITVQRAYDAWMNVRRIYRAMRLKEIEELQNPDLGVR